MTGDGEAIAAAVARSATVAEVAIGAGILTDAGRLYVRHFGAGPACIIADQNTWTAAGGAVEAALRASGIVVRHHILPARPRPKPTVELAEDLKSVLAQDDATPVAVGSGVMNDIVKYAAFHLNRPYLCVATAASMDGYTSAGSPLSEKGFKKTVQCRPAKVVLADLDIIAAAPRAMTGWGYGDLAGKVPAGGDWVLADALGVEPIDTVAWPMVQTDLRRWLAAPEAIAAGDRGAMEGLFAGLTLVGLAMEAHGSSRPASGSDHQVAHLWEMEDLSQNGERVSHGACVAVGCTTVLALYDWLLRKDLTRIDSQSVIANAMTLDGKARLIEAAFGPGEIADRAFAETARKHLSPADHRIRLALLKAGWHGIAARLRTQLVPAPEMHAMLSAAGSPSDAADIGVTPDHLRHTVARARFLRDRYTILDLLDETGLLERAINEALPRAVARASGWREA